MAGRPLEILVFITLLGSVACTSSPEKNESPAGVAPTLTCADGGDASCAIAAGVLIGFNLVTHPPPATRSERAMQAHTIFGHCEIRRTVKSPPEPCSDVRITASAPGATNRIAWVEGTDFDIPGLQLASYDLEAYSSKYDSTARLSGVKPGQFVRLDIKIQTVTVRPK